MFNYPADMLWVFRHIHKLVVAEQTCTTCGKWFRLPLDKVKDILTIPASSNDCVCLHCGRWQTIYFPGEYDSVHAETCYNQRYGFYDV